MRAALVTLVVACYQGPSPAGIDAAIDGVTSDVPDPPPGCVIPTMWGAPPPMSFGSANAGRGSFTTDVLGQVGALDIARSGNEHDIRIGPSGTSLTTVVVADTATRFHVTPRLSPEGLEMYFMQRENGVPATWMRYTRSGPTFVAAGEVKVWKIEPQALAGGELPGTPTAISQIYPRRMMMQKGGNGFWEIEQSIDDALRWDFVRETTALDLGLAFIRDPQLSPDGLRLVFAGTTDAITTPIPYVIYGATRTSLSAPFASPVKILDVPASFPFLSADCQWLYFRGTGSGLVGGRPAQ